MAMKKADLEAHRDEYEACMAAARAAEAKGMYRAAVDSAKSAWPFIDGMMQYERRYGEREFSSVPAIEVVLRYAPLLFDSASLAALEDLLTTYRRIDKNTSDDLAGKVAAARQRMWQNHRLWSHVERNPGTWQDALGGILGGDQDYWRWAAQAWERMGLLSREADGRTCRLTLITQLGRVIRGKCPSCGRVSEAPKAMLLDQLECPECRREVSFVLLAAPESARG